MTEPITTTFRVDIEGSGELERYKEQLQEVRRQIDELASGKKGVGVDQAQVQQVSASVDKLDKALNSYGQTSTKVAREATTAIKSQADAYTQAANQAGTASATLGQRIQSMATQAKDGLSRLAAEMNVTAASTGKLGQGISQLGSLGGAAGVGIAALTVTVLGLAKALADSAREMQLQQTILRGYMANVGQAGNMTQVLESFKSMRTEMQLLGVSATEMNVNFRRTMLDVGNNSKLAVDVLKTSLKVAAVAGEGFEKVADGIGKAIDGKFRAISEIGVNFTKAEQEALASVEDIGQRTVLILERVNSTIKDQSTGADTLAAAQNKLTSEFKAMNMVLSGFLVGPATGFTNWLTGNMALIKETGNAINSVGSAIASVIPNTTPQAQRSPAVLRNVGFTEGGAEYPVGGGVTADGVAQLAAAAARGTAAKESATEAVGLARQAINDHYKDRIDQHRRAMQAETDAEDQRTKGLIDELDKRTEAANDGFKARRAAETESYRASQKQMAEDREADLNAINEKIANRNKLAETEMSNARASAAFARQAIATRETIETNAHQEKVKQYEKETRAKLDGIAEEVKERRKADADEVKDIEKTLRANVEARSTARDEAISARNTQRDNDLAAIKAVQEAEAQAHQDLSRFYDALDLERRDQHATRLQEIDAERDAALKIVDEQIAGLDRLEKQWSRSRAERDAKRGITDAEKGLRQARASGRPEDVEAAQERLAQARERDSDRFISNVFEDARAALKVESDRIKDIADARRRATDDEMEVVNRTEKAKRQEFEDTYQARVKILNTQAEDVRKAAETDVTNIRQSADDQIKEWNRAAEKRKEIISASQEEFLASKEAEKTRIEKAREDQVEVFRKEAEDIRTKFDVQRTALDNALRYQETEIKAQHDRDIERLTKEREDSVKRWKDAQTAAETAHTAIMGAISQQETEFNRTTAAQRKAIQDDHAAHQTAIKKTYLDPDTGLILVEEKAREAALRSTDAIKDNLGKVKASGDEAAEAYKAAITQINELLRVIQTGNFSPTVRVSGIGSAPTGSGQGVKTVAASQGVERWRSQIEAAARANGISEEDMPEFVARAMAIIHHETGGSGDPKGIYNDDNGQPSVGLFRVNLQHGQNVEYWQNPQNNINKGVGMLAQAWRGGARSPYDVYTAPGSINPGATPDWSGWHNGRYAGGLPAFQANMNAYNQAYGGGGAPRAQSSLYSSQNDLIAQGMADAENICGPLAYQAWSTYLGYPITPEQARQIAIDAGSYDPVAGQSNGVTKTAQGMQSRLPGGGAIGLNTSSPWEVAQREASQGRLVTISTPAHYFQATGYNPETGQYFVGQSGAAIRHRLVQSQGGRWSDAEIGNAEWLTPEQMEYGGPAQGTIFDTRGVGGVSGGKPRNAPFSPPSAYMPNPWGSPNEYLEAMATYEAARPRGAVLSTMPSDYETAVAAASGNAPFSLTPNPRFAQRDAASFGFGEGYAQSPRNRGVDREIEAYNKLVSMQESNQRNWENQLMMARNYVLQMERQIADSEARGVYDRDPKLREIDQNKYKQALNDELNTREKVTQSMADEVKNLTEFGQRLSAAAKVTDDVVQGLHYTTVALTNFREEVNSSPFGEGGRGLGRAPNIWDNLFTMQKLTGGNGVFGGMWNLDGDLFNNPLMSNELKLTKSLGLNPNGTANYSNELQPNIGGNPFVGNAPGPINAGNIGPGPAPGGPSPFGPGTQGNISYAFGGWPKGGGYATGMYRNPTILVGDSPSGRAEAVISQDNPRGAAAILSEMPPEFWQQLAGLGGYNVPGPSFGGGGGGAFGNLNNLGPNTVIIEVDGRQIPLSIWQANIMGIVDVHGAPTAGWTRTGNIIRRTPAAPPVSAAGGATAAAGFAPGMSPMAAWGIFNSSVTSPSGAASMYTGATYSGGAIVPPPPTLRPPVAPSPTDITINPAPTQVYLQVPVSNNINVGAGGQTSVNTQTGSPTIYGMGGNSTGSSVSVVPPGQALLGGAGGAGATIGQQLVTASQIGPTGNYPVLGNPIGMAGNSPWN